MISIEFNERNLYGNEMHLLSMTDCVEFSDFAVRMTDDEVHNLYEILNNHFNG